MTKEERDKKRDAEIDDMIDRFHMMKKCSMSREAIHKAVEKGMVLNNFAFVLADVHLLRFHNEFDHLFFILGV